MRVAVLLAVTVLAACAGAPSNQAGQSEGVNNATTGLTTVAGGRFAISNRTGRRWPPHPQPTGR